MTIVRVICRGEGRGILAAGELIVRGAGSPSEVWTELPEDAATISALLRNRVMGNLQLAMVIHQPVLVRRSDALNGLCARSIFAAKRRMGRAWDEK